MASQFSSFFAPGAVLSMAMIPFSRVQGAWVFFFFFFFYLFFLHF